MGKWTRAAQAVKERYDARETLLARLQAERDDAAAQVEKWRALAEMTRWAELSSGAAINAGDRVRHGLHTYACVKAHTKALTRSPINTEYWTTVAD